MSIRVQRRGMLAARQKILAKCTTNKKHSIQAVDGDRSTNQSPPAPVQTQLERLGGLEGGHLQESLDHDQQECADRIKELSVVRKARMDVSTWCVPVGGCYLPACCMCYSSRILVLATCMSLTAGYMFGTRRI